MDNLPTEEQERLRALAQSLDCIVEDDFCLLADITAPTAESWRKRHTGPDYVLIGNTFLYPREPLKKFLQAKVRKMRGRVAAKAVL